MTAGLPNFKDETRGESHPDTSLFIFRFPSFDPSSYRRMKFEIHWQNRFYFPIDLHYLDFL
jgi:hypothetical protein